MAEDRPQIYLITPPVVDLSVFPDRLAGVLDAAEVACLRLALAGKDEYELGRVADALRALAHERDLAVVIDSHVGLAHRHGLDGVHLLDSARSVRAARKELGPDAIVGAWCGASRDAGMSAGEAGADYVAFGPVGDSALGSGKRADLDLFAWWSDMIELPVVAEGALTEALVRDLAPVTDFFAFGPEIWATEDPAAALKALAAAMG
ncbi:MAG: thiamine phosphate synthase [Proteobacteria bacterium]|nr:thiamine phosphate synthase [Pseudomonadota bacterium]MBS0571705.1 thiamine phosphate synthase [Pseudomonadota bacterium]